VTQNQKEIVCCMGFVQGRRCINVRHTFPTGMRVSNNHQCNCSEEVETNPQTEKSTGWGVRREGGVVLVHFFRVPYVMAYKKGRGQKTNLQTTERIGGPHDNAAQGTATKKGLL